ncbi:MAG TPA: CotH kinase family protein [Candidatus Merdivicinus intestinigallinarum]|nr:CotH kinase family protein [Candidatus Merdivicinus intestinigallinarum]
MLKHKWIDGICLLAVLAAVLLTILLMNGEKLGIQKASAMPGYVHRLFDGSRVHTIDIQMEDWDGFLETALEEAYSPCTVVIDGEVFERVGIRAKGNNSLRLTEKYGLNRYSLKLEFDHYTDGNSYFGLDKFSLDASFQDNSYLKSYLAYDMMRFMEVPSPLCSYVWVTVNGEDWGLFLAVEEPEEAFCRRNFGTDFGQLYKPDYRSLNAENADVALKYVDENPDSYDNIFRKAKFKASDEDKQRVIDALRVLSTGENLETAIDVDEVLRYFTVQVFVVNMDSYLGRTGHNYFLYEEDGFLQILPWDYNLAFGTYSLGMPDPINDAELYVNYPINTPASGEIMLNRPLYHNLMKVDEYFAQYHAYFHQFIRGYFESGRFEKTVAETAAMIAPYVEKDPTAFCSYEDFQKGVETIYEFCRLRAESVRKQLSGEIPATIKGQLEHPDKKVDASSVWLPDMGEIADLRD